jgi:hypothetical protein
MDVPSLRRAYAGLLEAADTVARAGSVPPPPPGEWDADQLLAHVLCVDAEMLAVASSITAGRPAAFDNRLSLDPWNLARTIERAGGPAQLRRRVQAQGEALTLLAQQLDDGELGQPVPTLLLSGGTLVVDQVLTLDDLISGLAEDHLPRHAEQLLGLLSPPAVSEASGQSAPPPVRVG